MSILIVGVLGYIGSHVAITLLQRQYNVVGIDNLCNTSIDVLDKFYKITNKTITFYPCDMNNADALRDVFSKHTIDKVIHLAALKSVRQSIDHPLDYYDNNVSGTITLLKVMNEFRVNTIVFSSTAAVYQPTESIITEDSSTCPISPYGHSKLIVEDMLKHCRFNVVILRYFNPLGNHASGLLMDSKGENIMPMICQSVKNNTLFNVFGGHPTSDGTCIRDYIHVMDLAEAHVHVLNLTGYHVYNVGTNVGTSVLELINTMSFVLKKPIDYTVVGPRAGDITNLVCSADKIQRETGWQAIRNVTSMCRDVATAMALQ